MTHNTHPEGNTLSVITRNRGKAQEIGAILEMQVEAVDLDISEIQSLDVCEVAREKAKAAYKLIGRPVVVDDAGMTIAALKGLPGALVGSFLDTIGPSGILKLIANESDRRASVLTCIGYADERGVETFLGEVQGELTTSLRGEGGFGYDPIFVPQGQSRTYAEMTADEKNSISMRKIALVKLRAFLSTK